MKKITFFINSLTSGGAQKVLSVIISELITQQYAVELIAIEKEEDNVHTLPLEVKRTYLSNLSKDDSNLKKLLYLPYIALKLKRHIQKHNIPLVQSHISRANLSNILAKLFGAGHQVQVVESTSISNRMGKSFAQRINFFLIQHLYKYANLIVFKAKRMQSEFFTHIPIKVQSVVINNPYDITSIEEYSQEAILDFNFEQTKQYIITVGRLTKIKQQQSMIKSLLALDERIELIIIGDGELKEELVTYIKQLNLNHRVHLLGKKSNPFKYVNASNIFLLSSRGEGFPNVLIESMICKTPVISTDCISGPREILAPSSNIAFQLKENIELAEYGILYPIDDEKALLTAINTLLNDSQLQADYIRKGIKKSQEYALAKIIKQYKEILLQG